ncbi:MAG TPA: phosphoenolpyruvate mutase [Methylomusa anaerophila]|uniref:Aminotransferase n=1 Tax=Methylomusa anaerophila TaxID=1930071 RepID=A0A348AFP0_9FIRM|nr:phosphoenolpyruvate mutase [Methylomusa anaerophila]BBB89888.1 aspartate aminotransferase [Methylomusa anaerophila]HML90548.1 phosphoenolpyruvate mutase [Methylomusa anaerophila]
MSNTTNNFISKSALFRQHLFSPETIFLMEAHNGLSAKIVQETGFDGIWASGLSISASLGVRDSNEASWTQVLEILEFMSDATSIPILVDGDTGYGNFNNVRRLVKKLCQRGIAAVCIEDKLFPKTNSFIGNSQQLADIDEFCGRIKAGQDSKTDPHFSIIARVEALIAGAGMDEALRRAEAYHQAGADAILIHSKQPTAAEVLEFARRWANRCPLVIVPTKYYTTPTEVFRQAKISMIIWANHNLRACISMMRQISQKIKKEQSLVNAEKNIASVDDIFDLVNDDELREAEKLYLPQKGYRGGPTSLAARNQLITESHTAAMRIKAQKLKEQGIPVVNFAAGELDIDTSEAIKTAAQNAIAQGYNKYTETLGIKKLREGIAAKITRETGVVYTAAEVGITVGAKQALYNSAMVLFESGDEVIIPSPYWVTFPAQVRLAEATPVFLDTEPCNYQIDIEQLKTLITPKTKAMIMNTPNNPTGVVYRWETLQEIAKLAIANNLWIIFDECYADLVHSPYEHYNIVKVVKEVKERTIVVNSFSKSCALTGWRIGYVCAPSLIIKAIQKMQGHMTSNVCSIAQHAVLAALEPNHNSFVENTRKLLKQRLDTALEIINTMDAVTYVVPQGAFYVFLNVKQLLGKTYHETFIADVNILAQLLLEEAHVAVVPGDAFGNGNCIRISYAISQEDISNGLQKMKDFFAKIQY